MNVAGPLLTGSEAFTGSEAAFTGTWHSQGRGIHREGQGPSSLAQRHSSLINFNHNQRHSSLINFNHNQRQSLAALSAAITHLLEGVDAAGLRLMPRATVGHARRRAVAARHGARRRAGATLDCGEGGGASW